MKRRDFLKTMAGSPLLPGCAPSKPPFPQGKLLGVSSAIGHRLRDGTLPPPDSTRRVPIVIVGGGIAGLSAAWALHRAGVDDFLLLELEAEAGGNARAGRNAISAYPWGAHYLPIPSMESTATRIMLAEFGLLQGDPANPRPAFDERHLCHAPHERLYHNGVWQDGLQPHAGMDKRDLEQTRRFEELLQGYRTRRDAQGRKAFAIPMEYSARDPDLLMLDRVSFRDFLLSHSLDSAPLHWYADYACRDDFGCSAAETSAWAGLHYFCCRDGEAANAERDSVLTWPEGNAWLARKLAARVGSRIVTGAATFRLAEAKHGVELDVFHTENLSSERIQAKHVIWSAPLFMLPRIWHGCPSELAAAFGHLHHAPWLIANLSLKAQLAARPNDAPLSWDNVLYESESLGYVVATHQNMQSSPGATVLTYYHALAAEPPDAGRRRLLQTPWRVWAENILRELSVPHPDLPQLVEHIDIWRNGHAMVRPEVGFMWGENRQRLLMPGKRLHLAHADLSGFSLFEEAQYRGVLAAERVMSNMDIRHERLLA